MNALQILTVTKESRIDPDSRLDFQSPIRARPELHQNRARGLHAAAAIVGKAK
jgi:hypothetical protein